jgi:hypothetical protein
MAGVSKTGRVTGAACPRCGAELKPLVGAGYQAQSCGSCKGIWVDNEGGRSIAAGAGELIDCATLPPGGPLAGLGHGAMGARMRVNMKRTMQAGSAR